MGIFVLFVLWESLDGFHGVMICISKEGNILIQFHSVRETHQGHGYTISLLIFRIKGWPFEVVKFVGTISTIREAFNNLRFFTKWTFNLFNLVFVCNALTLVIEGGMLTNVIDGLRGLKAVELKNEGLIRCT